MPSHKCARPRIFSSGCWPANRATARLNPRAHHPNSHRRIPVPAKAAGLKPSTVVADEFSRFSDHWPLIAECAVDPNGAKVSLIWPHYSAQGYTVHRRRIESATPSIAGNPEINLPERQHIYQKATKRVGLNAIADPRYACRVVTFADPPSQYREVVGFVDQPPRYRSGRWTFLSTDSGHDSGDRQKKHFSKNCSHLSSITTIGPADPPSRRSMTRP
jgi:hypothetical protein